MVRFLHSSPFLEKKGKCIVQRRKPRPGEREAEIAAREAIPDPKKPRNWDARIALGIFILSIIGQWVFRFSDMGFNQIIAAWIGGLAMVYFAFWGGYLRRKRNERHREKVRDRDNLRGMAVRSRISGRPWVAPPPPQPHWNSVAQTWDTRGTRRGDDAG